MINTLTPRIWAGIEDAAGGVEIWERPDALVDQRQLRRIERYGLTSLEVAPPVDEGGFPACLLQTASHHRL
jgi:hypothetical protein